MSQSVQSLSLLIAHASPLQIQTLELSNPTNWPLMIQPVFLHHYTRPHTIVNLLADRMDPELRNLDFSQTTSFAFQVDSQTTDSAINNVVIPPNRENYQITVAFTPKVDLQVASLLLIRNNLTVLDYVLLEGCGNQGMFTIDNIPPESEPLLFEFSTAQLEKCQGRVIVACEERVVYSFLSLVKKMCIKHYYELKIVHVAVMDNSHPLCILNASLSLMCCSAGFPIRAELIRTL